MKLTDGLYSMSTRKGGRVHAYLVDDGDGLTLIDTLYDDDAGLILEELSAIGRDPQDIKRICLTHSHKSHLGGLATIQRISGAPVLAHDWEVPIIEGRRKAEPVGFDRPKPFNLEVYGLQIALNLGFGKHTPATVHGTLKEGRKVGPLELLEAPGHTPGCVAFYWSERRVLIAGDTVATWPAVDVGWPSFNLDEQSALNSVAKMAELKPEIVCCGHGEPITEGAVDVLKGLATRWKT
jgi:glyoxylase-like metal-dependent hydrolase (beta-lactamase superfamily II)